MKRSVLAAAGIVIVLVAVYALRGPYIWPVSMAPGPCLKDFTSPNAWTTRVSPLRTTRNNDGSVLICYGAPVARGRTLFGPDALVPNGRLWRLGANEPTRLFTSRGLRLGNLNVPPGRYALYAEPDSATWRVFVTKSTWHWGNQITSSVRADEIGVVEGAVRDAGSYRDTLQIALASDSLFLHWGLTQVALPITMP